MKVLKMELKNIKCFENSEINFSPKINVIVGANNNGKSTILNCVSILQRPILIGRKDIRLNQDHGHVIIHLDGDTTKYANDKFDNVIYDLRNHQLVCYKGPNPIVGGFEGIINNEPKNYIIPFQSKRKVDGYSEGITTTELNQVNGTLKYLYAKIDRISNPEYLPSYTEYINACDEIIGFRVSTTNSSNGKKGVYIIQNDVNIPIDSMGEGITNLLGLIVDLCRVENKLFIIEEPENDIHPKALKKLLELIIQKSNTNQFIITTHSNIVIRYLAAKTETKLFNIDMHFQNKIPTSVIDVVDTHEKRRNILEDLGYELLDYDLWNYWLFLEESSAEKIIKDYLIPWFVPELNLKLRTFSARSTSLLEKKFDDFNNLFVFLHLQPHYKNRVWVIIDGGDEEAEILNQMKEKYIISGWNNENFKQFTAHNFEDYYPECFNDEVNIAVSEKDKKRKRMLKLALLENVLQWIDADHERAKKEFLKSAHEVIEKLKCINK